LDFDFTGVVFDGGDFSGARFSGGAVEFINARFSGGMVDFHSAGFSGGIVDFLSVVDWSVPPSFRWDAPLPAGLMISKEDKSKAAQYEALRHPGNPWA
jgi:hypothetical protein